MTARLFSPSAIELAQRCQYAWALRYVAEIKEPRYTWADVQAGRAPVRARASALGTAMHEVLEAWYAGDAEAFTRGGLPGEIAHSGAHLLPHPELIHDVAGIWIEAWVGQREATPAECKGREDDPPTHVLDLGPVSWIGKRDLMVYAPGEYLRLGISAPDGWAQFDYKSTASISSYAKTPETLLEDLQANLYGLDACLQIDAPIIPSRWNYFETKKVRRAAPVDFVIELSRAADVVGSYEALALYLDTITPDSLSDVPKNPLACGDFGGCPHHASAGGPCDARRSLGGLIQARIPKKNGETNMGLSAEQQARFDALKNRSRGNAVAPVEEPEDSETDEGEGEPEPEPQPVARPRGRPAAAKAPPAAAKPVARPSPAAAAKAKAPAVTATAPVASVDGVTVSFTVAGDPATVAQLAEIVAGVLGG